MEQLEYCIKKYTEYKQALISESTPHFSKSKLKVMVPALLEIKDFANEQLQKLDDTKEEYHLFKALILSILGHVSVIFLESEEFSKAEEYLMEGLGSVSDPLNPYQITFSVEVRNRLGLLSYQRSQPSEAQKWFEEAEKLYREFRNDPENVPKWPCDLFQDEFIENKMNLLEIAHTVTKFHLAEVYRAQNKLLKSAIYCHEILKRTLVDKNVSVNWAIDSAMLSQFFMEKILFKHARHHLAAASYILDDYEETLKQRNGSLEEIDEKKEELLHVSSDVSRYWAKYGIFLLEYSNNRMSNTEDNSPIEEQNEDLEKLWFDSLDLSEYENQITDSHVVAFEDAREVFLVTQKHLNKAKEYYTLEDRASDHIQIVQDHSLLFRHLTEFEPDKERQYKMMKKRVDMLEVVLKELNPKYYMGLCRQLWFELGETYLDMIQIRFQKVKDVNDFCGTQVLKKLNALAEASISHLNNFLDSVRDKNKELLDPLPEELIKPTLLVLFFLGRLYFKYIPHDKREEIENTTKAYECFKCLVDFCKKNEKAKSMVGEKLNISREMMSLLQMKISILS